MRRVLVASHGYLANGIKSALELFVGSQNNIDYLNAYVGDDDINAKIQDFIQSIGAEDEAVIFTDLYGGSVNQKVVMQLAEDKKVFLITGFNLPVILEIVLYSEQLNRDVVQRIIQEAQIKLFEFPCNDDSASGEEECEKFFS